MFWQIYRILESSWALEDTLACAHLSYVEEDNTPY